MRQDSISFHVPPYLQYIRVKDKHKGRELWDWCPESPWRKKEKKKKKIRQRVEIVRCVVG